MATALPSIIGGVGGVASAIGGSRPRTGSSSYERNESSTAHLAPNQKKLSKGLFKIIQEYIKRGPEVRQSDRNFMRGQINDQYAAMDDNLEAQMAARGFSGSGKEGAGFRSNELDRIRTTATGESSLRSEAWNRFMNHDRRGLPVQHAAQLQLHFIRHIDSDDAG